MRIRMAILALVILIAPMSARAHQVSSTIVYRASSSVADVYADGTPVTIETTLSGSQGADGSLSVRWLVGGTMREQIAGSVTPDEYAFSASGDYATVSHVFTGTKLHWDASWVARGLFMPTTDARRLVARASAEVNAAYDGFATLERTIP